MTDQQDNDKQKEEQTEPRDPRKISGKDFQAFAEVSHIAIMMAGSVVIGYFLGAFLDKKLGTSPWLTLIFLLLGVAAGLKSAYDTMNRRR